MKAYRQKCWKCGGKGWLFDHALGIFTFGIGYLISALDGIDGAREGRLGNELCPVCEGKGYLDGTEGEDK